MKSERTVSILIGRDSTAGRPPREAVRAGLTATVAAVLSTYRSNSPDMVLDHPLWLRCARAITEVVQADETQVFGELRQGLLGRLLRRRRPPDLGTLETYAARLVSDPDAPEWGVIHWKRGAVLVAVAVAEPWYRVGGPAPYHDSYTMRVFLAPTSAADAVARMRRQIEDGGGVVDQIPIEARRSMTISVETAVQRLIDARSGHRVLAPFETLGEFTLEHAYAIQDVLRATLEQRGERSIGWKLGATSPAGQAVMGLKEPASGFLLPGHYASGAEVPVSGFADLRVEAEVAFRMRTKLVGPGVTAATALLARGKRGAGSRAAGLHVLRKAPRDRFHRQQHHWQGHRAREPPRSGSRARSSLEEVVYEHNGEVAGTYTAAEVMGNPLNALAWLANHLASRGLMLKPGDVVMSGAISKMLRPRPGDTIRARFSRLGAVSIKLVA